MLFKQPECFELLPAILNTIQSGASDLNCSGCQLNNDVLREIAIALKKNQTLLTLNLCENDFDDEGIIFLAGAIQRNNTLRELRLANLPKVTKEGVNKMAEVFASKPKLKYLDICGVIYQKPQIDEADLMMHGFGRMAF
ncbi:MAG: hypothetical protein SFW66_00415 [Gammaproteobacteria bacterium]|nr:hypothetical protein [Gammaproteobacteria bacterium]